MNQSLSNLLEIWGFESNFAVFSDGSTGFALELTPIDVSCWEDEEIDNLAVKIDQFLNSLPASVDLQFVQGIGRGNLSRITTNERLKKINISDVVEALHAARISILKKQEEENLIPSHTLHLFVRRTPSTKFFEKPKVLRQEKLFQSMTEEKLEAELAFAHRLRDQIIQSLSSLGIMSVPVSEEVVAEMIYAQWNPIRYSLLFSDVSIGKSGFNIGGTSHRVISLKVLPHQSVASMAHALRDLPFDSKLFVSVKVPDQEVELKKLQNSRRLTFSIARGKTQGVSDLQSEAKLSDLENLISEMIASGEKVFYVSLNVVLRSNNEDELNALVSQTLTIIRELSGAEGMQEHDPAFDIFCDLAIPNARSGERKKAVKTTFLSGLLPFYGPWIGHDVPSILLKGAQGNLVSFDPFAKELSNYNQIVTGGSGSGKSFLTNLLLLQMLKETPKIYIVDVGASYKKLCENLDGQYIPFHLNSEFCLNPFDLTAGETSPSDAKIKFLVGLVEMMTKENEQTRLGRLERAQIEEYIQRVYQTHPAPKLSDLRSLLLHDMDVSLQRLGKILSPWCGNTPYGRIIDRRTTVELDKKLVSFDLKGLESHPDLQAVSLFIITDYIWRQVQVDKSHMKFVVFDECWRLLESDSGSAFIGEVFRTFRKYFASAIAISQNIDDFAKSKVANAILSNTSIKWVLTQKGADQSRLREVLQLNDQEMSLISQLHQKRGEYSQSFLMAEDKHCVVNIEPYPLEYWIATTDPRDLSAFDELKATNDTLSQLDLLKALSKKFPNGVAAHKDGL
jgi:conjugal transfer ATP-binding protein TraC